MPLNICASYIDKVHVVDLGGAGGHAGVAGQATINVSDCSRRWRTTGLQHFSDEIYPAARRIVLVTKQNVCRTNGRAEPVMHAVLQDFVGLGNMGFRELLAREGGLHSVPFSPRFRSERA